MKEIKPNIHLKRERELRGWSQKVLAERVGTDVPNVSRWEHGHNKPNRHFQEQLCAVFEKDAQQLGFIDDAETEEANTSSEITSTLSVDQHGDIGLHSSLASEQETSAGVDLFTLGITALVLHQQQNQWDVNELEQKVAHALNEKVPDMANPRHLSRRSTLNFIASMPIALYSGTKAFGASQSSAPLVAEDVIPLYAAGIPACWRLFGEGGIAEIERLLPTYLSHLTTLAQTPSKLQKSAAGLLSQTHQLAGFITQQHENFGRAIEHCKQAAFYGQQAEDDNLQAMALIRLQDTYYENRRFGQWFRTLKQTEAFVDNITPLLRGRIYARLSFAYAYHAQPELAQRCLGLAQETFPSNPQADASFLYNPATHYILHANEALTRMQLGQPKEAWTSLVKAEEFILGSADAQRIEATGHKIEASIALNNLEESYRLFETLIGFTKQFGQELDVENTYDVYQQLSARWPHEKRIQQLEEYLH